MTVVLTPLENMAALRDDDTETTSCPPPSVQSMPAGLWPHAQTLIARGLLVPSTKPMRDYEWSRGLHAHFEDWR